MALELVSLVVVPAEDVHVDRPALEPEKTPVPDDPTDPAEPPPDCENLPDDPAREELATDPSWVVIPSCVSYLEAAATTPSQSPASTNRSNSAALVGLRVAWRDPLSALPLIWLDS